MPLLGNMGALAVRHGADQLLLLLLLGSMGALAVRHGADQLLLLPLLLGNMDIGSEAWTKPAAAGEKRNMSLVNLESWGSSCSLPAEC